ncbi:MAG TPA: aminotransferase class I/II-fold pyridoxal phosphate-dependent enzyme [Solirubrobacteraceae bacterium]|jgi:DNA-binding transcriptional MocR family regulator
MDQEVARTLDELERKILELERTLGSLTAAGSPTAPGSPIAPGPPTASGSPTPPGPANAPGSFATPDAHASAVGAYETAAQRPAPPAPPADRSPEPSTGAGWSRIVDEAFERHSRVRERRAPVPGAAVHYPAAPAVGSTRPTPAAPVPKRAGPEELLRFRDHLERAARELTHDYDELLGRLSYAAVSTPSGPTISFARGAPSLDIVDVDGLRDAAVRAFESDPAGTTAYGTSIGYPRLRSWIADQHGVEPERVLVTNGSMQADAFLFEQLVRAGDEVIVERPTYDRTLLSLRQRGANVHAVELAPDGIDTEMLARLLAGGVRPTLAHIIPNFQNPAGYTLSYDKRRHLLELAADHGFLVFEDDPYVALRFSGETLPTMLSMDSERVVYASSFSKTVCPGIRVGYLVGPPDLISAIAQLATNTYISPNMVAQSIVYEFCASGAIDRSIETVKAALAERAHTLAAALERELPEARFVAPQGGYFMWVTLPEAANVNALFAAAAERGVAFVKGTDFLLEGGGNTLRLAYSGVTPEQIDTGVRRLAEAYRSL